MSRARRETAIQTVRFAQALEDMKSHPSGEYHGLISLMTKDVKNVFPGANIDMRERLFIKLNMKKCLVMVCQSLRHQEPRWALSRMRRG